MKIVQYFKKLYQKEKATTTLFFVMQGVAFVCLVFELFSGNLKEVGLCLLTMFLFVLPYLISSVFRVKIPSGLLVIVFVFIFAAEILGELGNFYQLFPIWDIILHVVSGFVAASVGFSLLTLLNKKLDPKKFSLAFALIMPLCFALAVGVVWEMVEYGSDVILQTDMQKDTRLTEIHTVSLGSSQGDKVLKIRNIAQTKIYASDGRELAGFDGYLDVGLYDTMSDLFVGLVGAIIFGIVEYLYLSDPKKYSRVRQILIS